MQSGCAHHCRLLCERRGEPLMAVAGRPTTLDRCPQSQREAEAARCRSPAPPRDHALGVPVRSCTEGESGMLASLGVRGASGRWFSASRRPTIPGDPLFPCPACAGWTS